MLSPALNKSFLAVPVNSLPVSAPVVKMKGLPVILSGTSTSFVSNSVEVVIKSFLVLVL